MPPSIHESEDELQSIPDERTPRRRLTRRADILHIEDDDDEEVEHVDQQMDDQDEEDEEEPPVLPVSRRRLHELARPPVVPSAPSTPILKSRSAKTFANLRPTTPNLTSQSLARLFDDDTEDSTPSRRPRSPKKASPKKSPVHKSPARKSPAARPTTVKRAKGREFANPCLPCIRAAAYGRGDRGHCFANTATAGARCFNCASGHKCEVASDQILRYGKRLVAALDAGDEKSVKKVRTTLKTLLDDHENAGDESADSDLEEILPLKSKRPSKGHSKKDEHDDEGGAGAGALAGNDKVMQLAQMLSQFIK